MTRIIHMPLSGGDRKYKARQIRLAHGAHADLTRRAAIVHAEADAKRREAFRLDCDAWNALMFVGGPSQPSPTIEVAIFAGYDKLEVRCNRCSRVDVVNLKDIRRPRTTQIHTLEDSLSCRPCTIAKTWGRQRAHIVSLTCEMPPDPEAPRAAKRR